MSITVWSLREQVHDFSFSLNKSSIKRRQKMLTRRDRKGYELMWVRERGSIGSCKAPACSRHASIFHLSPLVLFPLIPLSYSLSLLFFIVLFILGLSFLSHQSPHTSHVYTYIYTYLHGHLTLFLWQTRAHGTL